MTYASDTKFMPAPPLWDLVRASAGPVIKVRQVPSHRGGSLAVGRRVEGLKNTNRGEPST